MDFDILFPILTGSIGAAVGAISAYVSLRHDNREARSQVMAESEQTIKLLKDQNQILRGLVESGELREAESAKRESRLEERVIELERDYRQLVLTITSMGLCAKADKCPDYTPGGWGNRSLPISPA